MKIILREEVGTLGNAGDLITVKDGYARNYLLPRKLAVRADQRNVKQLEHTKRAMLARRGKLEASAKAAAKVIEEVGRVVVTRSCGPEGKLFGSVTSRDIVAAFAERDITIEKRRLSLQEPYKALGDYDLTIRVGQGITSTVKVSVEPDEASAAAITAFAAAAADAAAVADEASSAAADAGSADEATADEA